MPNWLKHFVCWLDGGHSEAEVYDDFKGTITMECFGCKRRRKVKYDCPTPSEDRTPCPDSCDDGKVDCHDPNTNEEWTEDCKNCGNPPKVTSKRDKGPKTHETA